MSKATEAVAVAARKVSSSVTASSWDELLAAFRLYLQEADTNMRQAPVEQIAVLQGHARCAAQILSTLETCRDIAQKVETKNARSQNR